jgi:hypothetical protein
MIDCKQQRGGFVEDAKFGYWYTGFQQLEHRTALRRNVLECVR